MANGIIANRRALLRRLAYILEGRFPDVEECTQVGGGVHETRPEYLRKYKRTEVRAHLDGLRHALLMTPAAKLRLDALKASIAARRAANTATGEEVDIDNLPAETVLDATWDP